VPDHADFDVICPNNHNQAVSLTREEFERVVKAGAQFHCNTCDTNWTLSGKQIEDIRERFEKPAPRS